jgi:hypothetical protein
MVVDNADSNHVAIAGTWTSSTYAPGFYGRDYLHDGNAGKGTRSIRFTPDLPVAGDYSVYARWTDGSNRASNAPFEVACRTGVYTVPVNETTNGGKWVLLGSFPFVLGGLGSVKVHNSNTSAHVIADAVAFGAAFPLNPSYQGYPWEDDDGDGVCNYVEFVNGTDPENPTSYLKLDSAAPGSPLTLRFVARGGETYALEYQDVPGPGPWFVQEDIPPVAVTQEMEVHPAAGPANSTRIYRLVRTAP